MALFPIPSHADEEEAKAILGTMLELLATQADQDLSNDQRQKEEIQWNQPSQVHSHQTSGISSEEIQRTKQIQAQLTRIGFYANEVDGIAGPATTDAILSWETEFDQNIDGTLDDQELQFLSELVSGGFTTQVDYELAKEIGFATRKELEAYKRSSGNRSSYDQDHLARDSEYDSSKENPEQPAGREKSMSVLLRNAGQNNINAADISADSNVSQNNDAEDSEIKIDISVWILLVLVVGTLSYFLPSIIAFYRNHRNRLAILVLNIFAGWTGLVWIFTLVWSCTANIGSKEDPLYIRKG